MATVEERNAVDTWAEDTPVLAGLAAASVDGRIALGPRRGAGVARDGEPPEAVAPVMLGPCHAALDGFDLRAGVVVRAGERDRLERLCRSRSVPARADAAARRCRGAGVRRAAASVVGRDDAPAVRSGHITGAVGHVIPRPRIDLVIYYGVLAPRAPWRAAVVASAGSQWSAAPAEVVAEGSAGSASRRAEGYLWAELMRRTFGMDVLECPRCGGRLGLMALIEHTQIVDRILRHLGLPTDRPEPRPPRAPPLPGDDLCQFDPPADAAF